MENEGPFCFLLFAFYLISFGAKRAGLWLAIQRHLKYYPSPFWTVSSVGQISRRRVSWKKTGAVEERHKSPSGTTTQTGDEKSSLVLYNNIVTVVCICRKTGPLLYGKAINWLVLESSWAARPAGSQQGWIESGAARWPFALPVWWIDVWINRLWVKENEEGLCLVLKNKKFWIKVFY